MLPLGECLDKCRGPWWCLGLGWDTHLHLRSVVLVGVHVCVLDGYCGGGLVGMVAWHRWCCCGRRGGGCDLEVGMAPWPDGVVLSSVNAVPLALDDVGARWG